MKDILNFEISRARREGNGIVYRMAHKKRANVSLEFTINDGRVDEKHFPKFMTGIMSAWMHRYAKATRKALSPKQKKVYDSIIWFHQQEGRPPSHEEMCDLNNWNSKGTSHSFIRRLIAKGWLWTDTEGLVIPIDIAAPETTD